MRTLIKLATLGCLSILLTGSALARSIYGYVGNRTFPSLYTRVAVDLYREDGSYVTTTTSYWHPFGGLTTRYHFNNVDFARYYVVARALDGTSREGWTPVFRTYGADWSNKKAPNILL